MNLIKICIGLLLLLCLINGHVQLSTQFQNTKNTQKISKPSHSCMHHKMEYNVVQAPTDERHVIEQKKKNSKNRLMGVKENSQSYQPLRIKFDTTYLYNDPNSQCTKAGQEFSVGTGVGICPSDRNELSDCKGSCLATEVVGLEKRNIVDTWLIGLATYFQELLSVVRPVGGLKLVNATCGSGSGLAIPPSYTGTPITSADIILFITSRPVRKSVLAFASICQETTGLQRPVAAQINIGPEYIVTGNDKYLLKVVKHEILHALGFSSSHFSKFKNSNGGKYAQVIQKRIDTFQGYSISRHFITTPNVVQAAKDHFQCDAITGVALEEFGSSGTAGSHFETLLFNNELMTGSVAGNGYDLPMSKITLALLKDSGYYKVNDAKAEYLSWGYGKGCSFVNNRCETWETSLYGYFCNTNGGDVCSEDYNKKSVCQIKSYAKHLEYYVRFSQQPKRGGFSIYDYCPLGISPYSNGDCKDSKNSGSQSLLTSEYYGKSSGCFISDFGSFISPVTQKTRCFRFTCTGSVGSYKLAITLQGRTFTCTSKGEMVTPSIFGYVGNIMCPEPEHFCGIQINKTDIFSTADSSSMTSFKTNSSLLFGCLLLIMVTIF